ncbi:uncharacterized protein LOC129903681 [Solanum dulcamara]|uniref:uncharacterized protein LOC129903681 n=1 Tax=Solanum dulcamara TaxID=45834 RepID=UPI0024867F23|nr:uncharacterized protein LOC129903681 [Solanum dulcamara]
MMQSPRKYGKCMTVTTRSGKVLSNTIIIGAKQTKDTFSKIDGQARHQTNTVVMFNEDDEADELVLEWKNTRENNGTKQIEADGPYPFPPIHKPPPPFSYLLKNKAEDGIFLKFISMLKEILVNIPLVEALEQMPSYAKFMKDLVTKKRTVSFVPADNLHQCSAISTRSLVEKKEDSGAFTIGAFNFSRALCDLGASINSMLLAIYKQLGLEAPKQTSMRLLMTDRSVKHLIGNFCDMLVRVSKYIYPADFVILDCQIDFEVPIILGRPFLAIDRTLVDVEHGEITFSIKNKDIKFNVYGSMKHPKDMTVISFFNIEVENIIDVPIKERLAADPLPAIMMNFDGDGIEGYDESVNAL